MTTFIAIEKLRHHPSNPRKDFGDLSELADSIKQQGLICPLLVVPSDYDSYVETGTADEFFVIAGNRRLEACKLAGIKNVYCEVANVDDETAIGLMLSENIIRQNLSSIEEAQGFQLMLDMGKDVEQISNETGFKTETVKLRTKLNKLNKDNLQKAYDAGATLYELAAVADIEDEKEREKLLKKAGTRDFNNALARIKEDKKRQEQMLEVEQFFRDHEFEQFDDYKYDNDTGFIKLIDKDSDGNITTERGYIMRIAEYNVYTNKKLAEEDFDPNTKYYFVKSWGYTVYRDATEEEVNTKKAFDAEAQLKRDEQIRKENEVKDIETRHRQLREDFIKTFNNFKKKQKELKTFYETAFNKLVCGEMNTYGLRSSFNNLIEDECLDAADADKKLLFMAYTVLANGSYIDRKWNSEKREYEAVWRPCPNLDLLSARLGSLGYEMSEEEEQIQNGTHPIYVQPEPAEVDDCDDGCFGDEDENFSEEESA